MNDFKDWQCPWEIVGEDTGGYVKWCTKCGAIKDSGDKIETPSSDDDTTYCPDRGRVP